MLGSAFRSALAPATIALFVSLARFFGELADLPNPVTFLLGIIWLTFIVAVYWAIVWSDDEHPFRRLLIGLLVFSFLSRIPVFVLWWVTNTWNLGTHYNFTDSLWIALRDQFLYGTALQWIPGTVVGVGVMIVRRLRASGD